MFDWQSLFKYLLEGFAVGLAMFLIPSRKIEYIDILVVALTAAAMFAILDQFSPTTSTGIRQGSGFAIGYNQIGMGHESMNGGDGGDGGGPEKVCQMSGDICSYHPEVTDADRDQYLCKKQGDQCLPVNACKRTQNCDWENDAEQLPDASGRTCSLVDDKCLMTKPTMLEGFEGFNTPNR